MSEILNFEMFIVRSSIINSGHFKNVHQYQVFIAALFTIARTWNQPKCPLTDEWVKNIWHIYTIEYYSAIKRNEIELFVVR